MQYKVAICDDENIIINEVVRRLKKHNENYEICCFNSGVELLKSDLSFSIIFLDIEMEKINGIETALMLRENKYDGIIIFLTSHDELMSDAFKVKAFRFLNKPIDNEKFNESILAAEKEILSFNFITICEKDKYIYLKWSDIVYLEAYGDGTYIYDKNLKVYDTDNSLKYWMEQIGTEHFFQIHKSLAVSFLYVSSVSKNSTVNMQVYSKDLTISRRKFSAFKAAFFEYVKKHAMSL